MSTQHRALIVEDDPAAAGEIAEILKSLDFLSDRVANKTDALAYLEREQYCVVTLDLEIRLERDSIKGHVEHGNSLLREIRSKFRQHTGRGYTLPVIVVSGFAREKAQIKEVMREGAADVVEKPFRSAEVSQAVRFVLERTGRATHEMCGQLTQTLIVDPNETRIILAIPGASSGQRVTIAIGSRTTEITHNSLRILLRLMAAYLVGKMVHKREMGYTKDHGFQGIPRLRKELKSALEPGAKLIVGDARGSYRLSDAVSIAKCNAKKLGAIGDPDIAKLARDVEDLLGASGE